MALSRFPALLHLGCGIHCDAGRSVFEPGGHFRLRGLIGWLLDVSLKHTEYLTEAMLCIRATRSLANTVAQMAMDHGFGQGF